jgi:hypothetical protein
MTLLSSLVSICGVKVSAEAGKIASMNTDLVGYGSNTLDVQYCANGQI